MARRLSDQNLQVNSELFIDLSLKKGKKGLRRKFRGLIDGAPAQ